MTGNFHASIASQRMLIWLTIILTSLFGFALVILMRFIPPPPADLPADQVAALYRVDNVRFKIGAVLGLVSGGCLMPLTLVISAQMARLEKGLPLWALFQGMTGAVGTAFFWLPMLVFATAAFSAERAPELTLLLHEFGWLGFIAPLSLFPLQLLGIIVVAFIKDEEDRVSAFPRWMGYLNIWYLVQSLGGPIAVLFKVGIFSWNGLVPFWLPIGLFSIWLPALSYTLLRALKHQEQTGA